MTALVLLVGACSDDGETTSAGGSDAGPDGGSGCELVATPTGGTFVLDVSGDTVVVESASADGAAAGGGELPVSRVVSAGGAVSSDFGDGVTAVVVVGGPEVADATLTVAGVDAPPIGLSRCGADGPIVAGVVQDVPPTDELELELHTATGVLVASGRLALGATAALGPADG